MNDVNAEREKGFEPSTSTLARWHSTAKHAEKPRNREDSPNDKTTARMRSATGVPLARQEIRQEIDCVRLTRKLTNSSICWCVVALALAACGGVVDPSPTTLGVTTAPDAAREVDAAPDVDAARTCRSIPNPAADAGACATIDSCSGGCCWTCADRAWRNVCVVPAERGTDAESCLHCGEHCDSTADGGG